MTAAAILNEFQWLFYNAFFQLQISTTVQNFMVTTQSKVTFLTLQMVAVRHLGNTKLEASVVVSTTASHISKYTKIRIFAKR